MDFYHRLLEAAGSDHVLRDEPMAVHTTFRIGGPADYFVEPAEHLPWQRESLCAVKWMWTTL